MGSKKEARTMIDAPHTPTQQAWTARSPFDTTTNQPGRWSGWRQPHRIALLGIMLLSAFFNFWQLGQNGYGNLYYAAAVKSMGESWKAFFFNSFDATGFVTVDKPPLGFWLQVLSTKIFGFTPFAVFLPQAIAGVLSVLLIYWLVRRHFNPVAGLIAALVLAASPISVVTNRNNTIDSTLMLVLLLGTWAVFRAIETGKLSWLVLAAVSVGLGFNIKMLEAYLVVPAFALTFLLGAQLPWAKRISHLVLSGVVMALISLSWVLAVDLVPASLRPYVGSTTNNSEMSLAFGYNGLQRLFGGSGTPGGGGSASGGLRGGPPSGGFPGGGPPSGTLPSGTTGSNPFGGTTGTRPFAGGTGGPGGAGGGSQVGMFNTGTPGMLRLFTEPLGGQIVWFLPLALFGIFALAADRRFNPREDRQQQSLILWGTWLVTMMGFFSFASFFHQYYLSQMVPAIAALAGIAIVTLWAQYRQPGWRGWLLPIALLVTAAEQIFIILSNSAWGTWLIPLIALPTLLAAAILVLARWQPQFNLRRQALAGAVALGLGALVLTPAIWSAYPGIANTAPDLPTAGLTSGGGPGGSSTLNVNTALVSYLEQNQGTATYLVATTDANTAAPYILATGKSVMALGGFSGSDPILSTADLATMVKDGTVRYFLIGGNGGGPGGASTTSASTGVSADTAWVTANCTAVTASTYGGSTTTTGGFGGALQLYDCAGK